ncbi:DUF2164 domain-containing protein [Brevundimonas sp.]|uniref:DUF2164 domain-containing protein n=1 Tax=Brevundimonas sp. TaxID=1871086 RepID=UPI002AB97730|nr:DUF2164 domain-containing protein [Brevundimonas sp.]MDZ4365137.1 DUF2164 domain-containing protein [Brevundimonas sp.]
MTPIQFSREETTEIVSRLKAYFRDELDQDLDGLPAQMLLDFIAREIGPMFYNRALYDAQTVVADRAEQIGDAILGLEKPGR